MYHSTRESGSIENCPGTVGIIGPLRPLSRAIELLRERAVVGSLVCLNFRRRKQLATQSPSRFRVQ